MMANNQFFRFKELFFFAVGKTLSRMLTAINYNSYYLPLRKEINELLNRGYLMKRESKFLELQHKEFHDDTRFIVRLLSSDRYVFYQVIEGREYLPLIELISKSNAESYIKNIVDAGSNIGFSALFFNRHYPHSRIIAIEPDSENCKMLKRNIHVNGLESEVTILQKALWMNSESKLVLSHNFRDGLDWSKTVRDATDKSGSIDTVSLMKVFEDYNLDVIDILKIDIEGTEGLLFKDLSFTDCLKRVRFIALEIHEEVIGQDVIEGVLTACGFDFQKINETIFARNTNLIQN